MISQETRADLLTNCSRGHARLHMFLWPNGDSEPNLAGLQWHRLHGFWILILQQTNRGLTGRSAGQYPAVDLTGRLVSGPVSREAAGGIWEVLLYRSFRFTGGSQRCGSSACAIWLRPAKHGCFASCVFGSGTLLLKLRFCMLLARF